MVNNDKTHIWRRTGFPGCPMLQWCVPGKNELANFAPSGEPHVSDIAREILLQWKLHEGDIQLNWVTRLAGNPDRTRFNQSKLLVDSGRWSLYWSLGWPLAGHLNTTLSYWSCPWAVNTYEGVWTHWSKSIGLGQREDPNDNPTIWRSDPQNQAKQKGSTR